MLKALSIKNYALIDNLSIEFKKGFLVITGETGAGKSILLGALSVILGKRADLSVLKDKLKKCVVEGEFDVSALNLKPFFDKHDLDYDAAVFLRREIVPSGKSRAFINDTPVNLNVMKELGHLLVDIHSQHQTLMLSDSAFQMGVLDGYLSNMEKVAEYKDLFRQYKELQNKLTALKEEEALLKQEQDYLQFQFDELDSVELSDDSFVKMEERQQFLSHSEEVLSVLGMAGSFLAEGDENVIDRLSSLKESLQSIAIYYPKAQEFLNRLESVWLELKDMTEEISGLQSEGEVNPAELIELTARLDEIYRLQQKHRVQAVSELLALKENYSDKLQGITGVESMIGKVSQKLEEVEKQLQSCAVELSNARESGIPKLSKAVQLVLQKLGMEDAEFNVVLQPLNEYTSTGTDKIDFWFSANKGIAPGEVSKIASGGELSRLMLSIKSLITEKSFLPTVIFDEIDSGVSGDIAGKVGNIMKEMAHHHQLIVITHLPQIASKANYQYKVFKEILNNTTQTGIMFLDDDQRVDEIALMLSDERVTAVSREAARELMK